VTLAYQYRTSAYQYRTSTVPVPYQYRTSTVPVPNIGLVALAYQYRTSTVPVPYQYRTSTVPVPYQYRTSTVPVPYQYRTSTVPVPYQTVPVPYQYRTSTVPVHACIKHALIAYFVSRIGEKHRPATCIQARFAIHSASFSITSRSMYGNLSWNTNASTSRKTRVSHPKHARFCNRFRIRNKACDMNSHSFYQQKCAFSVHDVGICARFDPDTCAFSTHDAIISLPKQCRRHGFALGCAQFHA